MNTTEKNQVNEIIEDQNSEFELPNDIVLDGVDKIAAPVPYI